MDEQILKLLTEDAQKGLNALMKQYMGLVYCIVKGRLSEAGTREDIEECVSDTFAQFYENRAKIDLSKGTCKSYLAVLARRLSIDRYHEIIRKTGKNDPLEDRENDTASLADYSSVENRQVLLEAIQSLGEPDSKIILMKYYFGHSTKYIASCFHLKENTVDKKAQRGLAKLRECLEEVF